MWPALVWGRDTTRYQARYHDPVIVARDSTLKMLVLFAATWGRCWEIRVRLREDPHACGLLVGSLPAILTAGLLSGSHML